MRCEQPPPPVKFPMDSISCWLTFESYNYNNNEVQMRWNQPTPVLKFKEIELPGSGFPFVFFSIFPDFQTSTWSTTPSPSDRPTTRPAIGTN